ncbi:MAG: hypothetical protein ACKOPT_03070 [Cyanobium sp.]
MTQEQAQGLLGNSVPVEHSRYNILGEHCFKAFSHATDEQGGTFWHGFPIKWSDLPTEAMKFLGVGRTALMNHLHNLGFISHSEKDAWLDEI